MKIRDCFKIYECGICDHYHPWDFKGDCRDDSNRYGSPEEYAERMKYNPDLVEVLSMQDRINEDDREIAGMKGATS
jgi:hypothetical protein